MKVLSSQWVVAGGSDSTLEVGGGTLKVEVGDNTLGAGSTVEVEGGDGTLEAVMQFLEKLVRSLKRLCPYWLAFLLFSHTKLFLLIMG